MTSRDTGPSAGQRFVACIACCLVLLLCCMVNPYPATAAPAVPTKNPLAGQCSVAQWQSPSNFTMCVAKLKPVPGQVLQCVSAPQPETPDSGMPGWFASEPASSKEPGPTGLYSQYGYAGYDYITYDQGCVSPLTHPASSFEDTVANGEFMIATSIIGASNALRQYAWDPQSMWGWADPLVNDATRSLYDKVFTVFGSITLAVVGLYLLWRSRQSDMSNAVTTAGWAIFVMVVVTAIAAWPVRSAHVADSTLVSGLNVVHSAIGPESDTIPPGQCDISSAGACTDHRAPAVRASDTATDNMIYKNWLRGLLGSADSSTAIKYGPVLYDAKSLTWAQEATILDHPETRNAIIAAKQQEWNTVALQIKTEDPQAYSYLQGEQGMDRIGAGLIAILSSLFFAMFDITASILVLLGFLIFRWAVIAAPILGTIGMLRPASAGLRRLANAVLAAIFNIIIFGTGAAVYLFAVDLIMGTTTLPGWLQVVLMWLVGIVGWLLLRPYRRITQMGGKDPTAAITSAGSWHRRFLRDARDAARLEVVTPGGTAEPRFGRGRGVEPDSRVLRPESRTEDIVTVGGDRRGAGASQPAGRPTRPESSTARRPAGDWTDPDVPDSPANYAIYRPAASPQSTPAPRPASRPESSPVRG
jgi:hypothetical protein